MKLNPQQSRLFDALSNGERVDSLTCGERLGISGSAIHRRLADLKSKGVEIAYRKVKTSFGTTYNQYYLGGK
jgi:biotin operon repressor